VSERSAVSGEAAVETETEIHRAEDNVVVVEKEDQEREEEGYPEALLTELNMGFGLLLHAHQEHTRPSPTSIRYYGAQWRP
jgi:hypothetical protein